MSLVFCMVRFSTGKVGFIWSLRPLGTCSPEDLAPVLIFTIVSGTCHFCSMVLVADMVYLGVFCGDVLLYCVERLTSSVLLFPCVPTVMYTVCVRCRLTEASVQLTLGFVM